MLFLLLWQALSCCDYVPSEITIMQSQDLPHHLTSALMWCSLCQSILVYSINSRTLLYICSIALRNYTETFLFCQWLFKLILDYSCMGDFWGRRSNISSPSVHCLEKCMQKSMSLQPLSMCGTEAKTGTILCTKLVSVPTLHSPRVAHSLMWEKDCHGLTTLNVLVNVLAKFQLHFIWMVTNICWHN